VLQIDGNRQGITENKLNEKTPINPILDMTVMDI